MALARQTSMHAEPPPLTHRQADRETDILISRQGLGQQTEQAGGSEALALAAGETYKAGKADKRQREGLGQVNDRGRKSEREDRWRRPS